MSRGFSQCISAFLHIGIPVCVSCCSVAVVFCYIYVSHVCAQYFIMHQPLGFLTSW